MLLYGDIIEMPDVIEEEKDFLEKFDRRWDRTKELVKDKNNNRWKRRLDSMARLLEGSSICAAVTLIDNSFYIATNKSFPREESTQDQGYLLIKTVMSYFKKLANGQATEDDYKTTFQTICEQAIAGLQLPSHSRDIFKNDLFLKKVMDSKDSEDFRQLRDFISEQAEHAHFPADIGSAFVVCSALLKDFDKIIRFINDNKDHSYNGEPVSRFLQAIKSFELVNIVDSEKLKGKVKDENEMHAEMRLLSVIKDQLESKEQFETYIGISKLCCLDCHCMIYGINTAKEYQNTIETRGAHNVQHRGNWNPPLNITGNVPNLKVACIAKNEGKQTRGNSIEDPFTKMVVDGYNEALKMAPLIDPKNSIYGASRVTEYPDISPPSSQDNEDIVRDKYDAYKADIEKLIQDFKDLGIDQNLPQYQNLLIVKKLFELEGKEYESLWISNSITNINQSTLHMKISQLAKIIEIDEQQLIEIFKNKVYVGEDLAKQSSINCPVKETATSAESALDIIGGQFQDPFNVSSCNTSKSETETNFSSTDTTDIELAPKRFKTSGP